VPVLSPGESAAKPAYVRDDSGPRDPMATTARLRALSVQIMANRERTEATQAGAAKRRHQHVDGDSGTHTFQDSPDVGVASSEQSAIRALEQRHRRLIAAAEAAERDGNTLDLAKEGDRGYFLDVKAHELRQQADEIDAQIADLIEAGVREQR
jgi:hypothetical protein